MKWIKFDVKFVCTFCRIVSQFTLIHIIIWWSKCNSLSMRINFAISKYLREGVRWQVFISFCSLFISYMNSLKENSANFIRQREFFDEKFLKFQKTKKPEKLMDFIIECIWNPCRKSIFIKNFFRESTF